MILVQGKENVLSVKAVVVAGHAGTHLLLSQHLWGPRQKSHWFEAILHYIREFKDRQTE